MPIVVGIDEAGYGPLLGPLVVGATVWRVTPGRLDADFWNLLDDCVARRARVQGWRLPVGDSKQIYDRRKGLHTLERPVLAFARAAGLPCESLERLMHALGTHPAVAETRIPWYADLDRSLPVDAARSKCASVAERLRLTMAGAGVTCCGLLAQVVCEDRFNRRVAATGNKAAVLLEHVLRLLQRAGDRAGESDLYVRVDRLGGRRDYRRLLLDAFPQRHLHVREVSARRSRYRLASAVNDWHVEFAVEADREHLPVALASMLAKYVRELLMERFNEYWRHWLPELRPTAGYYSDALRFLADIRPAVDRAGVPADEFVRAR